MTEAEYSADPYYEEYDASAYKRSVDGSSSKEETATADEEVVKNPAFTNFFYGIVHAWMGVLGYLIWTYYPGLMSSNTWWKVQCPETAWDTTSITAAGIAATANCVSATATCPTIALKTNNASPTI